LGHYTQKEGEGQSVGSWAWAAADDAILRGVQREVYERPAGRRSESSRARRRPHRLAVMHHEENGGFDILPKAK
jgi:hypothetical protein